MRGLTILTVLVVLTIIAGTGWLMFSGNPDGDVPASQSRVEQLYASGQYEQALNEVGKAIEQEPDNAELYILLGKIQYKQGKFEEATAAFNTAIEHDEDAAEAFAYRARLNFIYENDIERARADNMTALSLDSSLAIAHVTEGDIAFLNGNLVNASQSYAEAIRLDDTSVEAYVQRGKFNFVSGYYDRAKADFEAAISLEENATTLARRAHANYYLDEFDLARRDALRAFELDSDSAVAAAILGLLEVDEGNFEAALGYLTLALEKDPDFALGYMYRGRYFEANQSTDAAFADFDKAIELAPTLALGYLYRGNAHQAQGHLDEAIDDYTASIARAENSPLAHFRRAETYRSLEDFDAALHDYSKTIELSPQFTPAYLARAEIRYFEEQDYTGAIGDLTRVIELEPTAYAYRLRSLAYAGLEQPQQARLDRDIAVEMEPDKPSIIVGGYDIQINHIWRTQAASNIQPANGQFLVIEIDLYNYSDEKLCLRKTDFEAMVDGQEIEPERMYQVQQEFFGGNVSYPPTEGSTCLGDARSWDTFIAYDVSEDITAIAIDYSPERETINFELWLMPEADSTYQFALAEVNGTRQIEFGELVYLEETLEDIIDTEQLTLDNCNSDAERTATRELTREEIRDVSVQNVSGVDGLSGGYQAAEVRVGIRYLQTESESESTRVTYRSEESFTIPPGAIAEYEIVWSTVSKQGELEVIQGAQTYTVPFTITDSLRADVRALPVTSCDAAE